ncbi:hypothetical protein A2U01_0058089, partial [Trifolium medium]|nr:hypothetical protein [Trifolium medium]
MLILGDMGEGEDPETVPLTTSHGGCPKTTGQIEEGKEDRSRRHHKLKYERL